MATKHKYHANLYLGAGIEVSKLDKLKRKLENRPLFSGLFVISISDNPSDLLDIIEAKMLIQHYYKNHPLTIVGLTTSHEEALNLVKQIFDDCLRERNDYAIKEYLLCGISS